MVSVIVKTIIFILLFSNTQSSFRPNWGSLLFILPNQFTEIGRKCADKSSHYCLSCYRTFYQEGRDGDYEAPLDYEEDMSVGVLVGEFQWKISQWWRRINFFSELPEEDCCEDQGNKYLLYGYINQNLSPDDYLHTLTNYNSESMRINHLW
ncbi:uncharacterized protein LOC142357439, partial [Convolutriloba macropyga]|uniref:uncharacterized protein LOC142357439 n=1 Tax=Convolutriloba macropyga TaxID=536237 RepID=UPI003F523720